MNVGFIGLGIMGRPMAKNLIKAGYKLTVYDKFATAAVEDLVASGAKAAASNKEVAAASDVVVTMLPNSPHVKEAVLGANGVLEGAKSGTILVGFPGNLRRRRGEGRRHDRRAGFGRRTESYRRKSGHHGGRRREGLQYRQTLA